MRASAYVVPPIMNIITSCGLTATQLDRIVFSSWEKNLPLEARVRAGPVEEWMACISETTFEEVFERFCKMWRVLHIDVLDTLESLER